MLSHESVGTQTNLKKIPLVRIRNNEFIIPAN